ncbi:DUF4974 domain-containing protein [Echinicola sediminis]
MTREEFMKLAEKHQQGIATKSESAIVEKFYESMQNSASEADLGQLLSQENGSKLYQRILAKLPRQRKTFRLNRILKVAASLILVLVMAISIKQLSDGNNVTITTAMGEQREILLKDGSSVLLDENSSLTYPETFRKNRTVSLEGRAFFSVQRNVSRPFSVITANSKVKVLGTSFDVNTHASKSTTVSVISGKVQVTPRKNPKAKAILSKNQQITSSQTHLSDIKAINNQLPIAWAGLIVLKNTSLGEAATILENRYGITLTFESEELKALRITGKFKNETLDNILKSIGLLKELSFDYLNPNNIHIKKQT